MLSGLLQIGDVIKADDSWCVVALSPSFTVPTLMIRQNLEKQDREWSGISYSGPLIESAPLHPDEPTEARTAEMAERIKARNVNLDELRQKYFIVTHVDNRPKYGNNEDKHRVVAQETDAQGTIKTNLQVTFNQLGTETDIRMKKPVQVGSRTATLQLGEFTAV